MKTVFLAKRFLLLMCMTAVYARAQDLPVFGPERPVAVTGYASDVMEPFITTDGGVLFFNSLNSGGNTNLHFAARLNDTTFSWGGLAGGCYDPAPDHLDAVASADQSGRFFWVSLRGYPAQLNNLHTGALNGNTVTAIKRVHGDFNIAVPGWLIMDACINKTGDVLAYANARFDIVNQSCGSLPCESSLGMAARINDTVFQKLPATGTLLDKINDPNYLVYAPQLSDDQLRLYFTRIKKGTTDTEICVAVRLSTAQAFGSPHVLVAVQGKAAEAPTFAPGEKLMYYHRKEGNLYKLFVREKIGTTTAHKVPVPAPLAIYPNPVVETLHLNGLSTNEKVEIYSALGDLVMEATAPTIDVRALAAGMYFVRAKGESTGNTRLGRFVKTDGTL